MMYVMCLFQSLPHSRDDLRNDACEDMRDYMRDDMRDSEHAPEAPASRPLSSATTASELGGYGAALEEALAWLLEAEERLAARPLPDTPPDTPPDTAHDDLALLKEHFHAHERFLLELSEQQCRVGGVLEEGARLLRDAALSRDEANEVRLQMRLLNERWEQLRQAAMRRQAAGHAALMRAQQHHLQRFRQWLTETEDRMSRMEAEAEAEVEGEGEAALRAARELHAELRRQQPLVDALADCVVVVDDEARDDAGVAEIEDELRALGERWSHACQWTLARLARLTRGARRGARRQHLQRRRPHVDRLEDTLKQMEANPVSEVGEVLLRIQELQRVKRALRLERRAVAHILQDAAPTAPTAPSAPTAPTAPDEPAEPEPALAEEAEAQLDRLDALLLILDVQASRIRELGFEFDIDTGEETSESPTQTEATEEAEAEEVSQEAGERAHTASKKPRLAGEGARDFQAGYRAFDAWARDTLHELRQCERSLEESSPAQWASWAERAGALCERTRRHAEERRQELAHVQEIQRRLAAEPALQGTAASRRNPPANSRLALRQCCDFRCFTDEAQRHADSIAELQRGWEEVRELAARLEAALEALRDAREVAEGAASLRAQLEETREWRRRVQADRPSHNQLIHLRNRLRALRQLEPRLEELVARGGALLARPLPQGLRDDVENETKRTKEEFEEMVAHLTEKEAEMKAGLGQRAQGRGRHEEEFRALQTQVADLEGQILAEHADVSTRKETESKIQHLKRLQTRFEELQSTYDAVVRERREKYDSGSVPDLNLASSVENLVTKVGDCKTILQQKIDKLEKGAARLARLEEALEAAGARLAAAEQLRVQAAGALPGDLAELQELLRRAQVMYTAA
ncbi:Dystrophin, isoforms A/C/F/G/H [Papilio machaon]|uniref:Dystrophin, isoforms A/C/F/G/H n=1 Tax=Papilio machaon TaxID=76193 RepID=A0A194RHQ0_PAPMA|nr:Dystrophin, isoforms A/C/F/G/H [Papilio machaon]